MLIGPAPLGTVRLTAHLPFFRPAADGLCSGPPKWLLSDWKLTTIGYRLKGAVSASSRNSSCRLNLLKDGNLVLTQQRYSIGEQTYRLLRLIHRFTAEDMLSRCEFLSNWLEPV